MATKTIDQSNLLMAYQAAIDLKIYEGGLVWSRFGVMLGINTLIVSILGFQQNNILAFDMNWHWIFTSIAFVGLLFCHVWHTTTVRGFATNKYWTYCARELEYFMSNKQIKQFRRGNEFRQNHLVSFQFGPNKEDLFYFQRPITARRYTTEKSADYIIYMFSIIYTLLFLHGLYFY